MMSTQRIEKVSAYYQQRLITEFKHYVQRKTSRLQATQFTLHLLKRWGL